MSYQYLHVRSVLEYVPFFRGKLFVLYFTEQAQAGEELMDALLDVHVLHEVGINLVLVSTGNDAKHLYDKSRMCEMRTALVQPSLAGDDGVLAMEWIEKILSRQQIPVVASGGAIFLTDSIIDDVAVQLGATKLIVMGDATCVPRDTMLGDEPRPIPAVLESEVAALIALPGRIQHAEVLNRAAVACRAGLSRVHLLDVHERGVLVDELFSEEGVGTMVHTDVYREIRPLAQDDVPELLSMIARSIIDTKLLDRTYEDIVSNLDYYSVLTLDESIVGCVAVYPYPSHNTAELGCLYIKQTHEGHGYGRSLCEYAQQKARDLGMKSIFAISKSAVHYFRDRLNYNQLSRDVLPPARRKVLESTDGAGKGVFGIELV